MDVPSPSDDALSQPTRARLSAMLRDLHRPAGTEELAEGLGLHPNGVRLHLARLREAGLVVRDRSPQAPGRPRDMWQISPDARPAGEPPTGYANLGRWPARVISPSQRTLRAVEDTGRQMDVTSGRRPRMKSVWRRRACTLSWSRSVFSPGARSSRPER